MTVAEPDRTTSACPLDCPDTCGVLVERDAQGRLGRIRGNPDHVWSRGHLCSKTSIFHELVHAENRLRTPLVRRSGELVRASWDEALDVIAANLEDPGRLADLAVSNLDLKVENAQAILETIDPVERLKKVHELITKELEVLDMQQQISSQARGEMDRSQREFFLRQQLKAIQAELGEGNELAEEVRQFRSKARKARMPKDVFKEVGRQINKLERMHPDAAETATLRNWLDWIVGLPWNSTTEDNLNLDSAQGILDENHYGLEKV